MFKFLIGTGNIPVRLTPYETGELIYENIHETAKLYFRNIVYRERTSILTRLINNLYIDEISEVRFMREIKARVRSATTVVGIYNGSNHGRTHNIRGLGKSVILVDDTPAFSIIDDWENYTPIRILQIDKAVTNLTHPSLLDSTMICSIDVVGLMVMYRNAYNINPLTPSKFLNKYVYTNMMSEIYKFSIINNFLFKMPLDNKIYAPYSTISLSRYVKVITSTLSKMVKNKRMLYGDIVNTIMLPKDDFNNMFRINTRVKRTSMYPYLLVWLPYVEIFILDDRFHKHKDMNHNFYSELDIKLSMYISNESYFNYDEKMLSKARYLLKLIKEK